MKKVFTSVICFIIEVTHAGMLQLILCGVSEAVLQRSVVPSTRRPISSRTTVQGTKSAQSVALWWETGECGLVGDGGMRQTVGDG